VQGLTSHQIGLNFAIDRLPSEIAAVLMLFWSGEDRDGWQRLRRSRP